MKYITDFLTTLEKITERDKRYKLEAYRFLLSALNYTVRKFETPRHVTGKELLEGIKEYGTEQFGPMTKTVFEYWGITSTVDFGNIVFNLINAKLLNKSEQDSLDDFKNGYDFKEAFGQG